MPFTEHQVSDRTRFTIHDDGDIIVADRYRDLAIFTVTELRALLEAEPTLLPPEGSNDLTGHHTKIAAASPSLSSTPPKREKRRDLHRHITHLEALALEEKRRADWLAAELAAERARPDADAPLRQLLAELDAWLTNSVAFQAREARFGNYLAAFRAAERAYTVKKVRDMVTKLRNGEAPHLNASESGESPR